MPKYKPGQSGNLKGRPRGSKNKNSLIEQALDNYSEENNLDAKKIIFNNLIGEALDGDYNSIKLILERLSPSLKPTSERIKLDEPLHGSVLEQAEMLIKLTTQGKVTPDTSKLLLDGLLSLMHIKEASDFEERLIELEGKKSV
ncbi:MAG: DUF5681 domain-containing protein [Pseudomonadota bacterium]